MAPTLYKHQGDGNIDASYWKDSGQIDSEGDKLYTFTGDVNDGDAKGASDSWVVIEAAASDDAVKDESPAPEESVGAHAAPDEAAPVPDPVGSQQENPEDKSAEVEGVKTGGLPYTQLEDDYRRYPEQKPVETVDDPTPTPETPAENAQPVDVEQPAAS